VAGELMLRFLVKHKITIAYLPHVLLKMRVGGTSNRSLKNLALKTAEDYRAWKVNGLKRKWYTIPLKNISKLPQFFERAGGGRIQWKLKQSRKKISVELLIVA